MVTWACRPPFKMHRLDLKQEAPVVLYLLEHLSVAGEFGPGHCQTHLTPNTSWYFPTTFLWNITMCVCWCIYKSFPAASCPWLPDILAVCFPLGGFPDPFSSHSSCGVSPLFPLSPAPYLRAAVAGKPKPAELWAILNSTKRSEQRHAVEGKGDEREHGWWIPSILIL